jgi:hypothetical protein
MHSRIEFLFFVYSLGLDITTHLDEFAGRVGYRVSDIESINPALGANAPPPRLRMVY